MSVFNKYVARDVHFRFQALKDVLHRLHANKAENLSDTEIARCVDGNRALIRKTKEFRDIGEISMHMVGVWSKLADQGDHAKFGDLAEISVYGEMPKQYALYTEQRLVEMATVLAKLNTIECEREDTSTHEWTHELENIRSAVSDQATLLAMNIKCVNGVTVSHDPRGFQIELELESKRFNSMNGTWGVKVDTDLYEKLKVEELEQFVWVPETPRTVLAPEQREALAMHLAQWPSETSFADIIDTILNAEEFDDLEDDGIEIDEEYAHLSTGTLAMAIEDELVRLERLCDEVCGTEP